MAKALTKTQLKKELNSIPEWSVNKKETEINRKFKTKDFISGLLFVARIAVRAEIAGHHPDIELSYGSVKVRLTTHEKKALTKKDTGLARQIDDIYAKL